MYIAVWPKFQYLDFMNEDKSYCVMSC